MNISESHFVVAVEWHVCIPRNAHTWWMPDISLAHGYMRYRCKSLLDSSHAKHQEHGVRVVLSL